MKSDLGHDLLHGLICRKVRGRGSQNYHFLTSHFSVVGITRFIINFFPENLVLSFFIYTYFFSMDV